MIISSTETTAIASRVQIDEGSIWICDLIAKTAEKTRISEARSVSIVPGRQDTFAAVHRFDGGDFGITAHTFESPVDTISIIDSTRGELRVHGERSVWEDLPRAYVVVSAPYEGDYSDWIKHSLVMVHDEAQSVEAVGLSWYEEAYDPMDQPIDGVLELPDQEKLIFSIRNSSDLVLWDVDDRKVVRRLSLIHGSGSPRLRLRAGERELWVSNYDTLIRLSPVDWTVQDRLRLQDEIDGQRQYIGEYAFNKNESICPVARPASGDVAILDAETFQLVGYAKTGRYPYEVALASNGAVFTRDLVTGDLLVSRWEGRAPDLRL